MSAANVIFNQSAENTAKRYRNPGGTSSILITGLTGSGGSVEVSVGAVDGNGAILNGNWHLIKTYTGDDFENLLVERGFDIQIETKTLAGGTTLDVTLSTALRK